MHGSPMTSGSITSTSSLCPEPRTGRYQCSHERLYACPFFRFWELEHRRRALTKFDVVGAVVHSRSSRSTRILFHFDLQPARVGREQTTPDSILVPARGSTAPSTPPSL